MSGFSDSTECPNCNKDCNLYCDSKPFDYFSHFCINCGLSINPTIQWFTLKQLNEERKEQGLRKLKKLPKRKEI